METYNSDYPEQSTSRLTDVMISAIVCLLFIMFLVFFNPILLHWSLIPIFACGVIIGTDAVGWFRSRWDIFDPKGIIGVLGLHFFFIAPMLYIVWELNVAYVINPPDWRPWYGLMACLNIVGLVCYNLLQRWAFNKNGPYRISHWEMVPGRAVVVAPLAFLVALIGQTIYFTVFGGWAGIMAGREFGMEIGRRGIGPFMILGHSLPPLLLIALTVFHTRTSPPKKVTLFTVFLLLLAFLVVQFYVAGFIGSRSVIMWGLFWAVGIIHFFWHRLSIKWVLIGMIPFLLFMHIYGFYKSLGRQAFGLFTGEMSMETLKAESGRTFRSMLLGALSRADIQPAITYTLVAKTRDYDYRYGKTYLFSSIAYVPYWMLPPKPYIWSKEAAGTEVQRGKGSYDRYLPGKRSTRVYGLAGEAMLNFGPIAIPFAFAVWGYLVGCFRRKLLSRHSTDAFFLLVPIFINLAFIILVGDSDNLAYFLIDKIMIPFLVVRMMCTKQTFWVSSGKVIE
ncbi:MAG: hypothetical protein ACYS8Y_04800 [Planctomycetota bacterium]